MRPMGKSPHFGRPSRVGVAYVVAVPYFVGARLTGTIARDSPAAIANSLAPRRGVAFDGGTGPRTARSALRGGARHNSQESQRALVAVPGIAGRRRAAVILQQSAGGHPAQITDPRCAPPPGHRSAVSRSEGRAGLDHFEGRSYPGWNHHAILAAMTFVFLQLERRRRREPMATFPEIALMREVMAALLSTARPGWLTLPSVFSGIRRCEPDNVVPIGF